jgi:hypothetical protein
MFLIERGHRVAVLVIFLPHDYTLTCSVAQTFAETGC